MATTDRLLTAWLDAPRSDAGVRFLDESRTWRRYSYPELVELVNGMAARLVDAGVRRGDIVPILVPAGPEFVASFFGVLAAGGTPTVLPLPWALQDADAHAAHLATIASAAQPRFGIATDKHRTALAVAAPEAVVLRPVLRPQEQAVRRPPAELALLQFTSGSRGRPRGVQLRWRTLGANLRMIQEWSGIGPYGAVSWLPLYHDMGLIGALLSTVTAQCEQAVMRPEHFVRSPADWLMEYDARPYQTMTMPNFGFERVVRSVRPEQLAGADFSHIRSVISGAERIDPAVLSRFLALTEPFGFRRQALTPAYGLAEATLAVCGVRRDEPARMVRVDGLNQELGQPVKVLDEAEIGTRPPDDPWSWHVGCGRPLDGLAVRLVDDADRTLGDDLLGQVLVTGPSVADGYRPHLADSTFRGEWLRTGDAAFQHDGWLYIVGRLGDRVKVHGRSVFAEDVEIKLTALTGIDPRRLAVLGGVHNGQSTIVVLLERDYPDQLETIVDVVTDLTAATARTVVRRSRIPVTSSGKPRRGLAWTRYVTGELVGRDLRTAGP